MRRIALAAATAALAGALMLPAVAHATVTHYGGEVTLRNNASDVMVGRAPDGSISTYAQNESWSYITDATEPNGAGIWDLGFVRLSWNRKPFFNIPALSSKLIQCQLGEASFFSRSPERMNWYDLLATSDASSVSGDAYLTCEAKGGIEYRIRYPNLEQECVLFSRQGNVFIFEAPATCGAEVFEYRTKGTERSVATLRSAPFRFTIQIP